MLTIRSIPLSLRRNSQKVGFFSRTEGSRDPNKKNHFSFFFFVQQIDPHFASVFGPAERFLAIKNSIQNSPNLARRPSRNWVSSCRRAQIVTSKSKEELLKPSSARFRGMTGIRGGAAATASRNVRVILGAPHFMDGPTTQTGVSIARREDKEVRIWPRGANAICFFGSCPFEVLTLCLCPSQTPGASLLLLCPLFPLPLRRLLALLCCCSALGRRPAPNTRRCAAQRFRLRGLPPRPRPLLRLWKPSQLTTSPESDYETSYASNLRPLFGLRNTDSGQSTFLGRRKMTEVEEPHGIPANTGCLQAAAHYWQTFREDGNGHR
jgi:hypothetical protein